MLLQQQQQQLMCDDLLVGAVVLEVLAALQVYSSVRSYTLSVS